ncbi:hypothetical protein BKA69DRAFT_1079537 [Paraphysoderma sedebokerense]|nr:hypothetical protein BKA69DRAFT_1079537 [Paraphysoderma sedebokerense]
MVSHTTYTESVSPTSTSVYFDHDSCNFTGLERILLSANGNVQRILSAYFNAPVNITLLQNQYNKSTNSIERKMKLECLGRTICIASSSVSITNPEYLAKLVDTDIGIGQFFRYLNCLPKFTLQSVGKSYSAFEFPYSPTSEAPESKPEITSTLNGHNGHHAGPENGPTNGLNEYKTIYRHYTLSIEGLECKILEVFPVGVLDMVNEGRL